MSPAQAAEWLENLNEGHVDIGDVPIEDALATLADMTEQLGVQTRLQNSDGSWSEWFISRAFNDGDSRTKRTREQLEEFVLSESTRTQGQQSRVARRFVTAPEGLE